MSARDDLKRLLEQRLEAGEPSIVLDELSAARVGRIAAGMQASPAPRAAEGRREPERERTGDSGMTAPGASGDWRAALRGTGASESAREPTKASREPGKTSKRPTDGAATGGLTPEAAAAAAVDGLTTLEAVAASVAGCTRCALYKTATNAVPGEGNPNADFMVIGEAPGATEDQTGRPFVGAAGKLLTQILAAVQLSREDVFICNVLKHRPPGNRNPEPGEVIACSPYLVRQIELIRPKVILALGTFSAQTLLETKTPIGKLRGEIHRYLGVPVVVTYHPAALLRNPAWKRPTWEDVQLARRILDSAVPGA